MIRIKSNSNKFNKELIKKIEHKLSMTFPVEYINFLQKFNGGVPEENTVELEESPSFIITSFFGTELETYNDILCCFKTYSGRIPNGCIPIASAEGGNIVCLNLSQDKYGYIYYWDHEEELMFEEGNMKLEDLYFISTSFDKFLNMIKKYNLDDENLSGYKVEEVWIDPEFLNEYKKNK